MTRLRRRTAEWLIGRLEDRIDGRPAAAPSLGVVFVGWDEERAGGELAELMQHLAGLRGVDPVVVAVANRAAARPSLETVTNTVITGDNHVREFTGWQRGIDELRDTAGSPNVWLLANDRFRAYGEPYLPHLTVGALATVHAAGGLAGRIDGYPVPVSSFGVQLDWWVATCFLLIADRALSAVGGAVQLQPDQLELCWPEAPDDPLPEGGPMSAEHAELLLAWLTTDRPTILDARWYAAEPLGPDSWPRLRAKSLSIVNEQLLSGRAASLGHPLMPLGLARHLGAIGLNTRPGRRALHALRARPQQGWSELAGTRARLLRAVRAQLP
jgi:hypothetical protein